MNTKRIVLYLQKKWWGRMLKKPFYFKNEYLISDGTNKKTKLKRVNVGKPIKIYDTIITDVCSFVLILFEDYNRPIQFRIKTEDLDEFKEFFKKIY